MNRLTLTAARLAAGTAIALTAAAALAGPAEIEVPGGLTVPESLTSDAAGNVYVGSFANGAVTRATPGAAMTTPFIEPKAGGLERVLGVFADDASGTLYVCSAAPAPGPDADPDKGAQLHGFDLATGAPKGAWDMPTEGAACNDSAVGADGSVYATDTSNMEVARLAPGADALEVWAGADGAFGPAGGVLDGISVVDGRVIVNTLATSKLFAVEVNADGSAGAVTELTLDRPIERPDGMRSHGAGTLLVVEGGRLSKVEIDGDKGHVTTVTDQVERPVSVTVVDGVAYVQQNQFGIDPGPDVPNAKAIAVPLD